MNHPLVVSWSYSQLVKRIRLLLKSPGTVDIFTGFIVALKLQNCLILVKLIAYESGARV